MRALCSSWTCRPFLPLFIVLAAMSCVFHSIESPAPGKMYPRGNHWAVGHLMGKKSINSFATLQQSDPSSENLRASRTEEVTEPQRYARLMQQKSHKLKLPQTHSLALPHSRRRREDRYKYLREITDLLLLALKLQENEFI
ncbi:gastrin-releasing peptide [Periophthalmus magnuspinnatus]|uniref:gastrin-releasing peptide n=1 Tax=Periophthalmus magnuspinnatus TaxID=409849 RepID=UPI00145A09A1|nr:gastrin-releasing peptide [Periophthalmus magnuspinnatus]